MPDFVVNDTKVLELERLLRDIRSTLQTIPAKGSDEAKKCLKLNRRINSALVYIQDDKSYPNLQTRRKLGYE